MRTTWARVDIDLVRETLAAAKAWFVNAGPNPAGDEVCREVLDTRAAVVSKNLQAHLGAANGRNGDGAVRRVLEDVLSEFAHDVSHELALAPFSQEVRAQKLCR